MLLTRLPSYDRHLPADPALKIAKMSLGDTTPLKISISSKLYSQTHCELAGGIAVKVRRLPPSRTGELLPTSGTAEVVQKGWFLEPIE